MGRRSPWAPVQQSVGCSLRRRHLCDRLAGAAIATGASATVLGAATTGTCATVGLVRRSPRAPVHQTVGRGPRHRH
eukprot:5640181-Alexandrium_andersonii.AAC.1